MFIPTHEVILELTPTDFEIYCLHILEEQICHLDNYRIQHNKIIEVDDGNYQIDGYIEFELMGITYKSLVECKHYKSSIKREIVGLLYNKIRATGAHKGILISSSNFQSDAIEFASIHGIALIQLVESGAQYHSRSMYNIICNYPQMAYNDRNPYIGVLQYQSNNNSDICCSYLSFTNLSLKCFLEKDSLDELH